ncbi:hypothetical protein OIU84_028031 [Salix udensis]|uniref:Uncharacterized protein n=1 Tax=Salix udensis TaxID=889485 RepID=A0AAD6KC70_9ROSI|nr:hypothetical protein OIU84_028031 [Salix udensis]
MQGQPLLDDELSSWMNSLIGGEILLTDENVAPGMLMPDAPETGLGTEPADKPFEMDMKNFRIFNLASVPLIACKVTVGRPSFSLLEDLNYTISKTCLLPTRRCAAQLEAELAGEMPMTGYGTVQLLKLDRFSWG